MRFGLLSSILFLNFFQMAHLSYYGTQILPSEILLLFSEAHEIYGTLKEDFIHIFIPLFFTIIPISIGWIAHRKISLIYRWKFIEILVLIYLLYNPIRTYVTGNTWGRQPSTRELTGMNLYLTLSYFSGKILPHKLTNSESLKNSVNTSLHLRVEPTKKSSWDKIVVVLGESLTPNHMQLFGYHRETTPFLLSQKDNPSFFYTTGISGGVSTDISVAYFLNLGFGGAGSLKAAKGDHCLFKLAKQQGFQTIFHSIQSSEQLRYISPYLCASSLDELKSLEEISPQTLDHQAAKDRDLLGSLDQLLNTNNKQFLFLHQRGSHSPWNLRFTTDSNKFSGSTDPRTDHYDNSVYEFDLFWKELFSRLSKTNQKVLVIYLSDHGESLGEKGKWGHGFLDSPAFEVPIIMTSFNHPLPSITSKLPKFMTHYNLGQFIGQELGFQLNQDITQLPLDYEVYGNDIDGFAGKAKIMFKNQGYSFQQSL